MVGDAEDVCGPQLQQQPAHHQLHAGDVNAYPQCCNTVHGHELVSAVTPSSHEFSSGGECLRSLLTGCGRGDDIARSLLVNLPSRGLRGHELLSNEFYASTLSGPISPTPSPY